jgi:hypothetical protein
MTSNAELAGEATADNADKPKAAWRMRLADRANRAETQFLTLLRYSALTIAALTLLVSAGLLAYGAVQQLGRTEVEPETVSVAADDVVPEKPQQAAVAPKPQPKAGIDQAVRKRTLEIYNARFKPFQRADTKITEQEVVDFIWSEERIEKFDALGNQNLVGKDQAVLADRKAKMLDALVLIDAAAATGPFKQQLTAYRDAKKVNVCTEEVLTRTRTVSSWDSSATYCPSWYTSPVGCPSTREIEEPYVDKVCSMKFPEDLESPAQQFASAVQRYADTAEARLIKARNDAEAQTARNHERKVNGIGHITTSGTLFLMFLGVMFLYLFVAMERHHRNLRRLIEKSED